MGLPSRHVTVTHFMMNGVVPQDIFNHLPKIQKISRPIEASDQIPQ